LRRALEKAATDSEKRAAEEKKYGGSFEPLQLRVANRLFGRTGYPFHAEFLQRTLDQWQAPLETASFDKDAEAARKHINGWVEDQTAKRIVDLIPTGGVDTSTRLVLVNALYFKAAWGDDFSEAATKPLPFFASGKTAVNVPTMYQKKHHGYLKAKGYAAATVPYTGYALQFLIILPDAKDGLAAIEKELTAEQLTKLSKLPTGEEVELYLPKFKIQPPTLQLAKHLQSLGMKSAFDNPPGSADFSRMAPRSPQEYLTISEVFHKTFMALDEKGTEAAAATAVSMRAGSAAPREKPKPVEFRVDHPFLFAIQHRESGTCLFLGRVNDPR
jgi:serpin B